jgi:hypothetical protein
MILSRRGAVPGEIVDAIGLSRSDQVLAWALRVGGGAVVAATAELIIVNRRGSVLRRPWVDVERAVWDSASATLAVWWVDRHQPTGLELAGNSQVPEVVNERVRSSIAAVRQVVLPGGQVGLVVLRKDGVGALTTQIPPARGVDLTDPEVRKTLDQAAGELLGDAGG